MQVSLMVLIPYILCYEQIFVRASTNIGIGVTYSVKRNGVIQDCRRNGSGMLTTTSSSRRLEVQY